MAAWADRYRFLAPEAGSSGGPWETSRVEVARGPMLAVTEPGVHIVTLMCCTQLLKTAFIENTWGYFAHLDPCPTLLLQPKDEAAKQFSRERISPMIRVTPVLRDGPLFRAVVEAMADPFRDQDVSHVVGIEARGAWSMARHEHLPRPIRPPAGCGDGRLGAIRTLGACA